MDDIAKKIASDYRALAASNPVLKEMLEKLASGKASYLDADKYALAIAEVLGKALHNNLGGDKIKGDAYRAVIEDVLPKGLHDIYEDVADYAQTIQKGINERMGIGLNAIKPGFNKKEADSIKKKAAAANSYDEIHGGLDRDMQHMAQNVATDTMKANAKLANDVGMEATVTRIYDHVGVHTQNGGKYRKDCEWCMSRAGTDVPYSEAIARDMFRRHPGCGCEISYTVNGKTQVQSDWRKNEWTEEETSNKRKKSLEQRALVDNKVVGSNEYRSKIDELTGDTKESRAVFQAAKEIFAHRDGTFFEDLAFYDVSTGKTRINKSYDYYENGISACKPNRQMVELWKAADEYTIIGIHNHPKSGAPSISDLVSARDRQYKYGIVLGHNGNIYKYSVSKDFEDTSNAEFFLAKLERAVYNKDEKKRLEAISDLKKLGVVIEVR